jgi:hypothetical protein
MLLNMKANTEALRALAVWVGMHLDMETKLPEGQAKNESADLVSIMTPIIKAMMTDHGFNAANEGMQIFGGHGFIREYGMEQFVRDVRITQIYEGTNGIQALDLVGRKMPDRFGKQLRQFFTPVAAFLKTHKDNAVFADIMPNFAKTFQRFQMITLLMAQRSFGNPEEAGAAATDYLRCFGLIALGYMWLLMMKTASEKLAAGTNEKDFYETKLKTAAYFFAKILPDINGRMMMIQSGSKPVMALAAEGF